MCENKRKSVEHRKEWRARSFLIGEIQACFYVKEKGKQRRSQRFRRERVTERARSFQRL